MKSLHYFYVIVVLLGLQSCRKAASSREYLRSDSKTEMQKENVALSVTERENNQKNNRNKIYSATELFKRYNSAVFMVFTTDGYKAYQGSGFFISKDGLAVSNYHVFKGTAVGYEVIKLSDGRQYKIDRVVAKSESDDYILFRVKGQFNYICQSGVGFLIQKIKN